MRSRALLVAGLFAVGHDLGCEPEVLLCLDDSEGMAEALVLDDGGVTDARVLAEDTIGKNVTSPANFQRSVSIVEQLDVLTLQSLRNFGLLQDDLLAVVVERELCADVALLAVAEDVVQPGRSRS